ncbi:hypothetical protein GGS21DRAFT_500368 [Xylaria nigripes]|nr:hypothetical protein GGS21DRAFT_500368 [Xylaria nigripes]
MAPGLEIPTFGPAAPIPQGATRIELNAQASYGAGGLTPSFEEFMRVAAATVPVRIMIRPRGAPGSGGRDFVYSEEEVETMEAGVRAFRATGLMCAERGDGFVFGILREGGEGGLCCVDVERCRRLVRVAEPFRCVFHRAFDEIVSCGDDDGQPAWEKGLEDVAACGFDAVLTSGGLGKAVDNMEMLECIIRKAKGLGLEIIVGGGVRTANAEELIQRLGFRDGAAGARVYLHSACLYPDGGENINPAEVEGIVAQLR